MVVNLFICLHAYYLALLPLPLTLNSIKQELKLCSLYIDYAKAIRNLCEKEKMESSLGGRNLPHGLVCGAGTESRTPDIRQESWTSERNGSNLRESIHI